MVHEIKKEFLADDYTNGSTSKSIFSPKTTT
ncbi:hypothetical protein COLO4_21842 [Corchorus olitorius]|uniref:Uncharacterized protein n=1 Tax=Corchorus olitorius TaxID=93759 RepID=A0A1R3IQC5_9ROSI|nr:hypothetical protein COLO4_21842 [Corchorus olitorius]